MDKKKNSDYLIGPREHLLYLDKKFGGHLSKLYGHNLTIFDTYLGSVNGQSQMLSILPDYEKQLISFLNESQAAFDKYMVFFIDFIQYSDQLVNKKIKPWISWLSIGDNKYKFSDSECSLYFEKVQTDSFDKGNFGFQPGDRVPPYTLELYRINFASSNKNRFSFLPIAKLLISPYTLWMGLTVLLSGLFYLTPNFPLKIMPSIFYKISYFAHIKEFMCNWALPVSFTGIVLFGLWDKIIHPLKKFFQTYISTKIIDKYSLSNRYSDYYKIKSDEDIIPLESFEFALHHPKADLLGFNILAAFFYYTSIHNKFVPEFNKIIIIDDKRGMGKSSFINFIIQRLYGITYRGSDYCLLFHQTMRKKNISVVQLSILTFLSIFDRTTATAEQELNVIVNLLKFIASNIETDQSKIIYKLISNIETIQYKDFSVKLLQNIKETHGDSFMLLKEKLRRQEQPLLLIIEDIDRLNENQLKILTHFLWFIYDLPFTITLLPGEKKKLSKAVNLNNNLDQYEELEQYKLFQAHFSIKDYTYKILARQVFSHFDTEEKNRLSLLGSGSLVVNMAIKLSAENKLTNETLKESLDDWTNLFAEKFKYEVTDNFTLSYTDKDGTLISQDLRRKPLNLFNIIPAMSNDIEGIFIKYNVSIREFKYLMKIIRGGGGKLFVIQQILLHMLEYRYPNNSMIEEYLQLYSYSKEHPHSIKFFPNIDKIKKERFTGITEEAKKIIDDLEQYPTSKSDGLNFFISNFFNLHTIYDNTKPRSTDIQDSRGFFDRLFLRFFLCNNDPQSVYKILSADWKKFTKNTYTGLEGCWLSIEHIYFIVLFNNIASASKINNLAINESNNQLYDFKLYFFQNMAICFLLLAMRPQRDNADKQNIQKLQECFMPGKNTEFYFIDSITNKRITINFINIFSYLKILFNLKIHENQLVYDKNKVTLHESVKKIKELFALKGFNVNDSNRILNYVFGQ